MDASPALAPSCDAGMTAFEELHAACGCGIMHAGRALKMAGGAFTNTRNRAKRPGSVAKVETLEEIPKAALPVYDGCQVKRHPRAFSNAIMSGF